MNTKILFQRSDRLTDMMKKQFSKLAILSSLLISGLFTNCKCKNPIVPITTNSQISTPAVFYNLEAIDLGIEDQADLSFVFNDKGLVKQNKDFYMSNDLIVYCTEEKDTEKKKWKATVIGAGGVNSHLKISSQNNLIKEVPIKTTHEVFPYQDKLGPEWPGMYNIGNTCWCNATYQFLARCPEFDHALTQDIPDQIHTYLRNIVNGIRLGKRSALWQKTVNRKVSEVFLNQLNKQLKSINRADLVKTIGDLGSPVTLFETISLLLFPNDPKDITPSDLESVLHIINTNAAPYGFVAFLDDQIEYFSESNTLKREYGWALLSAPHFLIMDVPLDEHYVRVQEEVLQVPIYDYKTKKKLTTKSYKLVAACEGLPGHHIAFIHHQSAGWIKYSDNYFSKADYKELKDSINLARYELQD